jgi:membrane-bound serine protease (ClpP class)
LLLAGLLILVAEVFIPSGGLLAIMTTVVLSLSAVCAYAAWYRTSPGLWWTYCSALVLAVPGVLMGAFYLLPRTPFGKVVLLEAPEPSRVEPFVAETARLQQLVGRYGLTQTRLNPGGFVLVNGERLHAFSEGLIVEPQTSVEILEVRGTRVLVRPGDPPLDSPQTAFVESARERPLDFDVPAE